MRFSETGIVLLLAAALAICGCSATPARNPLVAVELESRVNAPDGCVSCGCRLIGELEPGMEGQWWMVFGLAPAGDGQPSQRPSRVSHCGHGPFLAAQADFEKMVGIPLAIADLSITARAPQEETMGLDLAMVQREFAGFDPNGHARYTNNEQHRSYHFQTRTVLALPWLTAGKGNTGPQGVHEVLITMQAALLGAGPAASYGNLLIRSDMAGAAVMLDGNFVGRTAEEPPLIIRNVPAGSVDVSVRDFSGRTATRGTTVKAGEMIDVQLDVLDLASQTPVLHDLIPVGANPQGFQEHWRKKDGALLVEIPSGEFLMGNSKGDAHEQPLHRVYLSSFLIDKIEVTWRQFGKYLEATGTRAPPEPIWGMPQSYPASLIKWREAQAYCDWVGGHLPTEAEWEKAARGSDGRTYQWGNEWDPRRCNAISGGPHRPESAGSFPGCHSPYGVLDQTGSMWEWTLDWYQTDYYDESVSRNPEGPTSGSSRVIRGGGWMTQPTWLRASYRFRLPPNSRRPDLGFRCVHGESVP
jgi:formylglycine-generating enzyme required for sulfatase activity